MQKSIAMFCFCLMSLFYATLMADAPIPTNNTDQTRIQGIILMPTKIANRKAAPTAKLVAEDHLTRQGAKEEICHVLDVLSTDLCSIVSDPDNHVQRQDAVTKAMEILGKMRSPHATATLVKYIGFPDVSHPEARETTGRISVSGGDLNKTVEQLHPAVPALIAIGEPCVDEVIKKLATTDNNVEIAACEAVLRKLSAVSSISSRLELALESTSANKRAQVQNVIRKLPPPSKQPLSTTALSVNLGKLKGAISVID
jgi:hypothetical protein